MEEQSSCAKNVSSLFILCFSLCTSVRNIAHFLRLLSDLTVLFAKFLFLLDESSESFGTFRESVT